MKKETFNNSASLKNRINICEEILESEKKELNIKEKVGAMIFKSLCYKMIRAGTRAGYVWKVSK